MVHRPLGTLLVEVIILVLVFDGHLKTAFINIFIVGTDLPLFSVLAILVTILPYLPPTYSKFHSIVGQFFEKMRLSSTNGPGFRLHLDELVGAS